MFVRVLWPYCSGWCGCSYEGCRDGIAKRCGRSYEGCCDGIARRCGRIAEGCFGGCCGRIAEGCCGGTGEECCGRIAEGCGVVKAGVAVVMRSGVAVLVVGLVALGCSEPEPLLFRDSDNLEAVVLAELVPDLPTIVTDVTCPEMIEPGPVSVSCEAMIDGVPATVEVDIDARGRTDLAVSDVFLVDVSRLADHSAQRIATDLGPVQVVCNDPPVVVAVDGKQLDCYAVDPSGRHHSLEVMLTSDKGDWQISFS